ncbi:hypothetical protein MCEMRH37_00037 [Candidatus Nanopelagicaceae bacterium]
MSNQDGFTRPSSVGLVFPFNEVNAAVFQNAGLWAAKRNFGVETTIYTPNQFRGLYFSVDKILEILPLPFRTYQEVSEHEPNTISKKEISTWLSKGSVNYLHHKTLEMLPANVFHALPAWLRSDYKTNKYLNRSGILRMTSQNFYSYNPRASSKFLGDGLYFNLAKYEKKKKNLREYFQYSFENLYEMISSQNINYGSPLTDSEASVIDTPLDFLSRVKYDTPKIFLRTRNINSSVSFQNAPVPELTAVVNELLRNGFVVINSGVPAASLGISDENYLEYSHNLPIETEMKLANKCDYVMQTAWAGLFTAFASFHKPLITFSEEWSLTNILKPVSLLKARERIGIKDIQLGMNFAKNQNSVVKSVEKIVASW